MITTGAKTGKVVFVRDSNTGRLGYDVSEWVASIPYHEYYYKYNPSATDGHFYEVIAIAKDSMPPNGYTKI